MGKMRMKMMSGGNSGAGAGAGGAAASGAGGAGGIAGSGIMGHLMTGSVIQCKSDDTSMFCTLSKIVNGLILILMLVGILYLVYYLFKQFVWNKRGGGLSAGGDNKLVGGYMYSKKSRKSKTLKTKTL
jgi:hypothetical protein